MKVQYPGVGEAIEADLRNADLLGAILQQGFGGLDPDDMVAEIKERLIEELDYRLEAANQQALRRLLPRPSVHPRPRGAGLDLSTARVLTTELVDRGDVAGVAAVVTGRAQPGRRVPVPLRVPQPLRHAPVQRRPAPGQLPVPRRRRVTFLDFGLVKRFTDDEIATFVGDGQVARPTSTTCRPSGASSRTPACCAAARRPTTTTIGEYFSQFYESVKDDKVVTWSSEYASRIVRHTFDRSSPISQYATVPKAFVFIQRINLGLYALLGELRATGNYRRIAEELWPFVQGPPSTPMAEAEQPWLKARRDRDGVPSG